MRGAGGGPGHRHAARAAVHAEPVHRPPGLPRRSPTCRSTERVARARATPAFRRGCCAERRPPGSSVGGLVIGQFDQHVRSSATRPTTSPPPRSQRAPRAERAGVDARASCVYDLLLADDGHGAALHADPQLRRRQPRRRRRDAPHPFTVPGLSDGGAHVGTICDGSFPTTLLAHWGRDRSRGARSSCRARAAPDVGHRGRRRPARPRRRRARLPGRPQRHRLRAARACSRPSGLRPARRRQAPAAARRGLPPHRQAGSGDLPRRRRRRVRCPAGSSAVPNPPRPEEVRRRRRGGALPSPTSGATPRCVAT